MPRTTRLFALITLVLFAITAHAAPLQSVFTYQGKLQDDGSSAEGLYDFEIVLYSVVSGGGPISTKNINDVSVEDGIFSLELDFGLTPFEDALQYWLEVRVRAGASNGAYTPLSPRQKLTATPYALSVLSLPLGIVDTGALADNAVTAAKIANNAVGADEIAANAVKASEIDSTVVQRRVSAECAAGSSIRGIQEDGTVSCEVDDTSGEGNNELLQQRVTGTCEAGSSIRVINEDGTVSCEVDDTSGEGNNELLQQRVTGTCEAGSSIRVINENGTVSCEVDDEGELADNEVTAAKIASNAVGADEIAGNAVGMDEIISAQVQERVTGNCAVGSSIRLINQDGTVGCEVDNSAVVDAWLRGGNAGTRPGTHFVGTTDNQALELKVNNVRVLRLEPHSFSPNVIGGYSGNSVAAGKHGATISGGGNSSYPNQVTANYGTIGGGDDNTASGDFSTVGGGNNNNPSGIFSTVGGGSINAPSGDFSTVGGGRSNAPSGDYSTVPGGRYNDANGDYSFAAGRRAKVGSSHSGSFVWADSTDADFATSGAQQFLIRAGGGLGLNENAPLAGKGLHIQDASLALQSSALNAESLIVEAADAVLGLYSDGGGSYGSTLTLGEVNGSGTLVNKWAITRQTSSASSANDLFFTFGTDSNYGGGVQVQFTDTGHALKASGGSTWGTISDAAVKTDIEPLRDALATLAHIRPVTFRYTEDYRAAHPHLSDQRQYNVIAQEFAEVFPEAVTSTGEKTPGGERELLTVSIHPALITTIAAVQELSAENQTLKLENQEQSSDIQTLQAENEALKARLARLEAAQAKQRPVQTRLEELEAQLNRLLQVRTDIAQGLSQ